MYIFSCFSLRPCGSIIDFPGGFGALGGSVLILILSAWSAVQLLFCFPLRPPRPLR
jgi:hypothetical protein